MIPDASGLREYPSWPCLPASWPLLLVSPRSSRLAARYGTPAFGPTTRAAAARVEREVRATVGERADEVESLARSVAKEGRLIADASASRDKLPALFDGLIAIAEPVDQHSAAVTIYEPDGPPHSYRVLAWSEGPGERDLLTERLESDRPALFIAPGRAGMRIVFVEPVEFEGRRVAVAVAETVLATTSSSATPERFLPTSFGPVSVIEQYASTRTRFGAEQLRHCQHHRSAVARGTRR